MKRIRPLYLAALLATGLHAQEAAPEGTDPKEMMQRLLDPQATQEQLLSVIKEASKMNISRQPLIEAKLIWGLRNQNAEWLAKLLPELEVLAANFDATQSLGLKSADEVRSFMAYAQALLADAKGDAAAFKTQILEAVWLNPSQAQLFTQMIDKKRREAKMADLKVDLSLVLTTSEGEATTLADQLGDKKALLLDFWASWCGPCMQLMPELKKKATELRQFGIVVAGMNKDDKDAQSVSAKIREEQEIDFAWLLEPMERPLTKLLEIESIPRMILISPDGKVLFNGHPQDPALWTALQKIDPAIKAPGA